MEALPIDFADPWEHVRLLSDRTRNDQLVELLKRRAPGARVLEVGCGTGLLSCLAAKLGAAHVWAVEATSLVDSARDLVRTNGLEDRVTVVHGRIEDLEPRPVDLVFSEMLNADPFTENVISVTRSASAWVAPGGMQSPRRLKVWVALAWSTESPEEHAGARDEVARMCAIGGMDPSVLLETLEAPHPHRFFTHGERPLSHPVLAFDVPLGADATIPREAEIVVRPTVDGNVGGALAWFSAEIDDDVWMTNPPGGGTHWGQMVCGWPRSVKVRRGQGVRLRVTTVGTNLLIEPIR